MSTAAIGSARNRDDALVAPATRTKGSAKANMPALRWAYWQKIKPATRKTVFCNLAYHYNDRLNSAWPSVALICEETSLDRDTVITALDDLQVQQRIEDTGQRKGLTRSVKVYRLVGFTGSSPVLPTAKQSEFSPKQSRFSLEKEQNTQLECMKSRELQFFRSRLIQERNSGKLDSEQRDQARGQLLQIKAILARRGIHYAASL